MESESRTVISREERYKVELTKGQRGGYGWTITVYAVSKEEAMYEVSNLNQQMEREYGVIAKETIEGLDRLP